MTHPLLYPINEPEVIDIGYLTPHEGIQFRAVLHWNTFQRQIRSWDVLHWDDQQLDLGDGRATDDAWLHGLGNSLRPFVIICAPIFDTYYDAIIYLRKHLVYEAKSNDAGGLQAQWYRWVE